MTAPRILRLVVMLRAKKAKIHPPLGVTTKSDFVFTQPGPRLSENSTRYKHTLNFEGCGQVESKKAIKFALRRAL
jgi:hypothetical protein